ncbi:MAG: peptidylprolyl isomerase, partial [Chloroflexi bacterium]|nr:peptidylprolyl isomerase [Chloroflexota bacterium]
DDKHSIFGQVAEGMDVVLSLANGDALNTIEITEKAP